MSHGIKSSETDGPVHLACVLYAFKNMPHFAIVRISVAAILFPVEIMGEPTPDLEYVKPKNNSEHRAHPHDDLSYS